jgi:hypothetical protein
MQEEAALLSAKILAPAATPVLPLITCNHVHQLPCIAAVNVHCWYVHCQWRQLLSTVHTLPPRKDNGWVGGRGVGERASE